VAEVSEDMTGAMEGGLGIGVPFDSPEVAQEALEGGAGLEVADVPREAEPSVVESLQEPLEELSLEQIGQGADGYQEVVSCRDPPGAVLVEAAGGDHDVEVDVGGELLVPCVQDSGAPGQGVEPWPSLGELEQGLGGGLEEQVVKEPLVALDQGAELVRQGEHHMEVSCGQESLAAFGDPADFLQILTLGAMTVSAGVESQAPVAALVFTGFQVPSECGGPALEDVADDLALLAARGVVVHVSRGMDAQDVAELDRPLARRCGPGAPGYFFRLHGLPPLRRGFGRASQGLWTVCR